MIRPPPRRWNRKSKRVHRAPCSGREPLAQPTTSAPKSASSRHNEIARRTYGYERDSRKNHLPEGWADREDHLELAREGQRAGPEARREVDAALLDADRDYDIKVLVLKA